MRKIKKAFAQTKQGVQRTYNQGKQKLQHHKITRGSGRTEDIFGMKTTTKIFLAIILIIFLTGILSASIFLFKQKKSIDMELQYLKQAVEEIPVPDPDPEHGSEEQQDHGWGYENSEDGRILVPPKERWEAEKIIDNHEPLGIGGFSSVCQVTIRDRERDIASAGEFLKEANETYNKTLEQIRGPRRALERAIVKVKKEKVELDIAVQNCNDFDTPIRE